MDRSIYDSPRLADGYAFARPPIHRLIVERIARRLGPAAPVARGLDLGCGAGVSTAALGAIAHRATGLEPAAAMLAHRHVVAPRARFVAGHAERLPFTAGAFDVMTAAGSINYADLGLLLPEVARVLTPSGLFVVYDFSAGRRLRDSTRLEEWHSAFERRFPPLPGYELDVRQLPFASAGLSLDEYEELELSVAMTHESYLRYAMSETAVELALSRGVPERAVRDWCRATLEPVFGDRTHDVLFDAYIAYVTHGRTIA